MTAYKKYKKEIQNVSFLLDMIYEKKYQERDKPIFDEKEPEMGPEEGPKPGVAYPVSYTGRLFFAANSYKEICSDEYEDKVKKFALFHNKTRIFLDLPSTLKRDHNLNLVTDLNISELIFETISYKRREDLKNHRYLFSMLNYHGFFDFGLGENKATFVAFLYIDSDNLISLPNVYRSDRINIPLIDSFCFSIKTAEKDWKISSENKSFEQYIFKKFSEFVNKRESVNLLVREQKRGFEL